MNILNLLDSIGGIGGISSFMTDYLQAIDKKKINLNLWLNSGKYYKGDTKRLQIPNVEIKQLGLISHENKYGIRKALKKLKEFDVVHRHSIWLPISLYSLYSSKLLHKKVVVQPHGALAPLALAKSSLKKKLVSFLYEKANMRNASIFVAVSHKEVRDLKKIFPNKDVALIPNGVPMTFFNNPVVVNSQYEKLLQGKRVVSLIARIHPIKGIERLIKAVSMIDKSLLRDTIFVMGGSGDKNYITSLKQAIRKYNLEDYFLFLGHLDREKKLALLDLSKCFILPSYSEGFSVSIIEALARGIPVISTKGTSWEEFDGKNCGLWVENNVEGIMNGIISFLQKDDKELEVMGNNARNLVKENYIFEHIIAKYETLYSYLCGKASKPDYIL